jgi:hypothetical protein
MPMIEPYLLPLAMHCGLACIATRTSRRILDIIALVLVLRGTTPADRPAILREFGRWPITGSRLKPTPRRSRTNTDV